MTSDTRLTGLGLIAGGALAAALLLLALFMNSMNAEVAAPSPGVTPPAVLEFAPTSLPDVPAPTQSARPTFTSVPVPTATEMPVVPVALEATLVPDPLATLIESGGLAFSGPLSIDRQLAVYEASTAYIQASVEDSRQAAASINEVGYGDPTNICGPLAIAILRDAGIVPTYLSPHDYWLLDPTKAPDLRLLQNAFPTTAFAHEVVRTPINKVDWAATPLFPGDFVFLWHGSGGNFDHMLVVSRVDSQGRTYSVTNFGTPDGYVIAETMLYDPADSSAGIFHTWTKERNAILGSTGFGGYEVWRLRES